MRRLSLFFAALIAVWFFNGGTLDQLTGAVSAQQASGDPVTSVATDNEEMNAAQDTAQESLPLFLANVIAENGVALEGAGLKVAFPISGANNAEIIWITPFKWDGGSSFVGVLANQPNWMEGLNIGDTVNFSSDMIRDWSWISTDGKLFGNFTTRVMIPLMDDETAASMTQVLSDPAIPSDWQ